MLALWRKLGIIHLRRGYHFFQSCLSEFNIEHSSFIIGQFMIFKTIQEWSYVLRIPSAPVSTPRKQDNSHMTSASSGLFLEVFMYLPGIAERSRFASECLGPLATVTQNVYSLSSLELYSCDLSEPSKYKLSDVLNEVGCCMRLQSASFIRSIFPGPTFSRVVIANDKFIVFSRKRNI